MIPPEMLVWFGAALLVAGIVLLVGWKLTEPPKYRFEPPPEPEYPPFVPAYTGRHRSDP